MLWGLQSRVTSRSCSSCVAGWPSGAMSPRVQNAGVHAPGLHVFPLSGSVRGVTLVGDGQTWSAWTAVTVTATRMRSEEHTSELQSLAYLVCRLLLEKKKNNK